MDPIQISVQIASTLLILLPIHFCRVAVQKKAEDHLRLFLRFLIIGFVVDSIVWLTLLPIPLSLEESILWLYNKYPIVEAMFFFWIIGFFSDKKPIQLITKYSIWLVIPVWLCIKYVFYDKIAIGSIDLDVFPALYRIVCSFLSTLVLLELVEHGEMRLLERYRFWILSAILFYCFTTFLILFLGKEIGERFWYLHNTMNILTYFIYSIGFYVYSKYDQTS